MPTIRDNPPQDRKDEVHTQPVRDLGLEPRSYFAIVNIVTGQHTGQLIEFESGGAHTLPPAARSEGDWLTRMPDYVAVVPVTEQGTVLLVRPRQSRSHAEPIFRPAEALGSQKKPGFSVFAARPPHPPNPSHTLNAIFFLFVFYHLIGFNNRKPWRAMVESDQKTSFFGAFEEAFRETEGFFFC
jgi:hypothetical protein